MHPPIARLLASHRTAATFLVLLAAAETAFAALSGHDQHAVRDWASTSVANLHSHPVGSLLGSAFIPEENPTAWLVLVCLGMFSADGLLGWRRSLLLVASAQVLGTLVSEGVVAWRVAHGELPQAARHLLDIGPSYLVVSALTLALLYGWTGDAALGVRIARPIAGLAGLVALRNFLVTGLTHLDVTAIGHTVSMILAALFGGALLLGRRRAATRQDAEMNRTRA